VTLYAVPLAAPGRLSLVTCPRPAVLESDIGLLAAAAVTLVVSALPEDDEIDLGLSEEMYLLKEAGIDFLRIPIEDFDVPSDTATVTEALDLILGRLADATQHVAVHCLGGLGRSPLVVASLLVLAGDDPETAWRIVGAVRRRPVPETPQQRAWIEQLTARS